MDFEIKLAEAESAAEATRATSAASGHSPLGRAPPSLEVEAVGVGSGSLPAWGPPAGGAAAGRSWLPSLRHMEGQAPAVGATSQTEHPGIHSPESPTPSAEASAFERGQAAAHAACADTVAQLQAERDEERTRADKLRETLSTRLAQDAVPRTLNDRYIKEGPWRERSLSQIAGRVIGPPVAITSTSPVVAYGQKSVSYTHLRAHET